MIYGYARVSLEIQNLEQQIYDLKAGGAENIFAEKVSSTKDKRPKFQELLAKIEEGDSIYVTRFDRFARSTMELLQEVEKLNYKKVGLKSLTQNWLDTTKQNDPFTRFTFILFAGMAELERDLTRQRVKEGLIYAKSQGRIGGRKPLDIEKQNLIKKLASEGMPKMHIARALDLGVVCVRKYCKLVPKGI